ncbi:MAG TPA: glycosyltransferase family 2 protein [Coriobacteriia bacterium]
MSAEAARKLISVVTPAYNEQDNIPELTRRLQAVFSANPSYDFEVIVVENGSSDATYERLVESNAADPRFKALQLARNFGADGGVTAGLAHATGDAAVIMCADLQDPPELITEFIEAWERGYENVYQIVTKREGTNWVRRMNSQLFYWLINAMTGGLFPRNVSDFRLVDRRVYSTINDMHEHNRFMRGMFNWAGFRSIGIEHARPPRFAGKTKANTRTVLALAIKGILSYSYVPLRVITYMGMGVSVFAFLFLIYIVIRAEFFGVPFAGYGTIMGVMLLMFGFLFTMLGVVAEYVGLIYEEVKQRPNYVVREKIGL